MERTFGIIKPDAVKNGFSGKIIDRIESEGFKIIGMRKLSLSKTDAESFYAVHKERPFYGELVSFMLTGPVVVLCMQKDNAVKAWRDLMGATNPADADANTLRKLYAESIEANAVHGSDSLENSKIEIEFFFSDKDLVA